MDTRNKKTKVNGKGYILKMISDNNNGKLAERIEFMYGLLDKDMNFSIPMTKITKYFKKRIEKVIKSNYTKVVYENIIKEFSDTEDEYNEIISSSESDFRRNILDLPIYVMITPDTEYYINTRGCSLLNLGEGSQEVILDSRDENDKLLNELKGSNLKNNQMAISDNYGNGSLSIAYFRTSVQTLQEYISESEVITLEIKETLRSLEETVMNKIITNYSITLLEKKAKILYVIWASLLYMNSLTQEISDNYKFISMYNRFSYATLLNSEDSLKDNKILKEITNYMAELENVKEVSYIDGVDTRFLIVSAKHKAERICLNDKLARGKITKENYSLILKQKERELNNKFDIETGYDDKTEVSDNEATHSYLKYYIFLAIIVLLTMVNFVLIKLNLDSDGMKFIISTIAMIVYGVAFGLVLSITSDMTSYYRNK